MAMDLDVLHQLVVCSVVRDPILERVVVDRSDVPRECAQCDALLTAAARVELVRDEQEHERDDAGPDGVCLRAALVLHPRAWRMYFFIIVQKQRLHVHSNTIMVFVCATLKHTQASDINVE